MDQNYLVLHYHHRIRQSSVQIWSSGFFSVNFNGYSDHHHHYHHVPLTARISLTLNWSVPIIQRFRQLFQTTSCVCTELMQISSYLSTNTSITSSSFLLQQWSACFVRVSWMVFEVCCILFCRHFQYTLFYPG